jgi:hypothetical protein
MSAALVRDYGYRADHQFGVNDVGGGEQISRSRNDAQLGIAELQVFRADVDLVAPPESAELAEPIVRQLFGTPSSGDDLRLRAPTAHDGPTMRAAVANVLAAGTSEGTQNMDGRELKMLRTLQALESTVANIQRQSNMSLRY